MREASEEDREAFLAAGVPREARDPGVRPDLDHGLDLRLGESKYLH